LGYAAAIDSSKSSFDRDAVDEWLKSYYKEPTKAVTAAIRRTDDVSVANYFFRKTLPLILYIKFLDRRPYSDRRDALGIGFKDDLPPSYLATPFTKKNSSGPRDGSSLSSLIDFSRPGALVNNSFAPAGFESRVFLMNLSMAFYQAFGVYYNVYYYPLARVFSSSPEMQEFASRALSFMRMRVTRQVKPSV
jgi:hypothetical protein